MSDHAPTKTMSLLAVLFGSIAILFPLAGVSTLTAAVAVAVSVVGVALFRLVAAEIRGASLAALVLSPLFGAGLVASAIVHVDIAAFAGSGPPPDLVGIAAGSVAGVVGATALLALFVGSLGRLSVSTVNDVFSSVARTSALLLVATAVSAGTLRAGIVPSLPPSPVTLLSRWSDADPRGLSIAVFTLLAFIGPLALHVSGRVRRLATIPIEPVAVRTESAEPPAESSAGVDDTEPGTGEPSGVVDRVVVWSVPVALALGFVRPVLTAGLEDLSHPRAEQLLALNEAVTAAVTTPTALRALVWSLGALLAVYAATVVTGWIRKRVDRRGSVFGTTGALALAVAGTGVLVHALRPRYEPLVAAQMRAADVPAAVVVDVLELLPAVILGGALFASVLALGPLVALSTYGGVFAGVADGLVYRNFVFLCAMIAIIATAVYGVPAAVIFVSVVAALLAWDFLEYGYALAVELDSRSLQPPEIAHAASSVGVGVALVGASVGAYEVGRTVTPPAELSYVALPVFVLAATLLILYFAE